jgi:trk system potassium uptake protein TrkH
MKLGALNYFLLFILLFAVGAVLIGLLEPRNSPIDFLTAMSASVSTLANVGPGLHGVGATKNYGWFADPSLWIMSLLMVLGRLEVYAIFVLFSPRFWRQD